MLIRSRLMMLPFLASLWILPGCSDEPNSTGTPGGTGGEGGSANTGGSGGTGGMGGSGGAGGGTGGSMGKSSEELTAEALEAVRNNHDELQKLVGEMPKGADLHSHTSGAVSTESLIQFGAEDGACIDTTTFFASPGPCMNGTVPMSNAQNDQVLYDKILGAWSMEGFSGTLLEGHQHFFDSFGKFGAVQTNARTDDMLAEVLNVAGKNKQIYIELMQGFGSGTAGNIAEGMMMPGDAWTKAYLLQKRMDLLTDPGFTNQLMSMKASIQDSIVNARTLLGCSTANPEPGCDVDLRMIVSANRTKSRAYVFGQWVFGYELTQITPEVVGLNLVSPEENANSLANYEDEMMAMGVLHDYNANTAGQVPVHFGLHAGELIPEVLPMTMEGQAHLTFHIRRAVEVAHAERIGHGVDVLAETDGQGAQDLLTDMAAMGVMVEICLTSNDSLLGVSGANHPLKQYMDAKVPVALSTDDLGILRTNPTQEYVRAVEEHGLGYMDLKKLARTSLEHAFISGKSLWKTADDFSARVDECAADEPSQAPSAACDAFLKGNEKAQLQWKMETRLGEFESKVAAP